jgi:hypothetical protein
MEAIDKVVTIHRATEWDALRKLLEAALKPGGEPVAWRKPVSPTDYHYDGNDWAFSETGFIDPKGSEPLFAAPPRREPLTTEKYTELAHRIATKYTHRTCPTYHEYAFLPHTLEQFVRSLEAAHRITGGKDD